MIYVMIPSYADNDLPNTVLSCIRMASGAIPLRIGVFEQASAHVLQLPLEDISPKNEHMRANVEGAEICWGIISREEHQDRGAGVGYARARVARWHNNAEYVLSIDAHSRFEPNWDLELVDRIASLPGKRSLVTGPNAQHPWNRDQVFVDEVLSINNDAIFHYRAPGIAGDRYAARHFSANFAFGPNWLDDVPPDPYIAFWGEQATTAVRLWTHGYDLYHIANVPVTHGMIRPSPRPWDDNPRWSEIDAQSHRRCHILLRMVEPEEGDMEIEPEYGLGDRRSLEEFQQWAGINFVKRWVDTDWGDWPRPESPTPATEG